MQIILFFDIKKIRNTVCLKATKIVTYYGSSGPCECKKIYIFIFFFVVVFFHCTLQTFNVEESFRENHTYISYIQSYVHAIKLSQVKLIFSESQQL